MVAGEGEEEAEPYGGGASGESCGGAGGSERGWEGAVVTERGREGDRVRWGLAGVGNGGGWVGQGWSQRQSCVERGRRPRRGGEAGVDSESLEEGVSCGTHSSLLLGEYWHASVKKKHTQLLHKAIPCRANKMATSVFGKTQFTVNVLKQLAIP